MANRDKNTKYPWDTDKSLQRAIPAPDEFKVPKRRKPRECPKLKGPHDFDFKEIDAHEWWPRDKVIWVLMTYRCTACNKKELLSYDLIIDGN